MKTTVKDPEGVEFNLETGYGVIKKVDAPEAGKRNAQVFITAEGLQKPVSGWADTTNPEVWDVVTTARDSGQRVSFRVETHRKDEVDKALPMKEVGQYDRFRRLVGMSPAAANGAPPAPCVVSTAFTVDQGDPGPSEPPDDGATPAGPRMAEGRPWERTNSDGSVNLGSCAVTASLGMVELAYELLCQRRRETGKEGTPNGELKGFARMLLDASDRVQAIIRQDHRVDRMDNSHTRARGAVRQVVKSTGVPWETLESLDQKKAWVAFLVEQASGLLALALELDR